MRAREVLAVAAAAIVVSSCLSACSPGWRPAGAHVHHAASASARGVAPSPAGGLSLTLQGQITGTARHGRAGVCGAASGIAQAAISDLDLGDGGGFLRIEVSGYTAPGRYVVLSTAGAAGDQNTGPAASGAPSTGPAASVSLRPDRYAEVLSGAGGWVRVDAGETTGELDVELHPPSGGATSRLTGTWSCARLPPPFPPAPAQPRTPPS